MKKILIYSSMGIGDFIMFVPVLRNISYSLPRVSIDVLYTHEFEEDFWKRCPFIHSMTRLSPPYFRFKRLMLEGNKINGLKLLFESIVYLRDWLWSICTAFIMRYDVFLAHYNCSNRPDVVLFAILCKASLRIGYAGTQVYRNYWTWAYNSPVTINIEQTFREMNLLCLQPMGITIKDSYPQFFISEEDRKGAFEVLNLAPNPHKPVILFSPGVSFFTKKQWPYSNFATVINEFLNRGNVTVIVTGTKQDKEIEQYLTPGYLNCIGKLSLGTFAALISLCDCVVCCEGGAMHLADAFKIRAVAIYGPQNRIWAQPYYSDYIKMIYSDVSCYPCNDFYGHKRMKSCQNPRCINSITPSQIITAIDEHVSF